MYGDWDLRKAETNIFWTSNIRDFKHISQLVHITTTMQDCRVRELSFNVVVTCLRLMVRSLSTVLSSQREKQRYTLSTWPLWREVSCSFVGSVQSGEIMLVTPRGPSQGSKCPGDGTVAIGWGVSWLAVLNSFSVVLVVFVSAPLPGKNATLFLRWVLQFWRSHSRASGTSCRQWAGLK